MRFLSLLTAAGLTLGSMASAQQCGGSFASFVQGLKSEAIARGHAPATVNSFFASARQDQAVLKADRQFECQMTLRAGEIVWDLNGHSLPPWEATAPNA